ncbi:MAG: hypothetical protein R3B95_08270 [Nitrospirales bacterium]|nr:hypothetical protein [Nitrospirales bacterium]
MNNYKNFAQKLLTALLGPNMAVRIIVGRVCLMVHRGYRIPRMVSGNFLCHWGAEDLMRDPDIVYVLQEIDGLLIAEPVSFQNDYLGVYQEVYEYNGEGGGCMSIPA